MCKAGIRQGKNERKSLHLFRHNVATTLLQGGVQQPVISATLGHASPDSLDRYLSAEFKRLKECSLSIEHFPIGKGGVTYEDNFIPIQSYRRICKIPQGFRALQL